ncbi:MAG: polyprenyl synthetase family protein [Bacteroidota bacterium]
MMNVLEYPISLQIPDMISLRGEIYEKVDDHFNRHPAMPPVSWHKLSEFAGELMRENEWDEIHRGFVMLTCGNAVWRRVVETVPYQRRILLLPQCLKNSHSCQASMDAIGLICNECGGCSIPAIVHEAENLGYVVLVTEGTTIATRLIESGKVDVVIGVGCMEVLQKMFQSVNKFAVPAIGIPLLTSGCKDTRADFAWIRQELYRFRKNSSIRLLNLNHIRNKTTSLFGKEQLERLLAPYQNETVMIVIDSLLAGGQRLRPFIATLTYEAFCTHPDDTILNRLALSVECFHKASLIHDDIEDDDPLRYGKQTIHAQHGIAVAINAGDLLIGEGYRLIAENRLSPDILSACFRVISAGHRAMTLGQGAELLATISRKILSMKEILDIFENKTSSAFRVSLLLGGTIGGADTETLNKLERFSHFTGIAYQIMDDMEDYNGQRGDIRFRKPSVQLAMLMKELPQDEWAIVEQAFIAGDFNLIYLYLENYKTNDRCICLLKENLEHAKESLENLVNIGLKLALHEILGKIFDKYL